MKIKMYAWFYNKIQVLIHTFPKYLFSSYNYFKKMLMISK